MPPVNSVPNHAHKSRLSDQPKWKVAREFLKQVLGWGCTPHSIEVGICSWIKKRKLLLVMNLLAHHKFAKSISSEHFQDRSSQSETQKPKACFLARGFPCSSRLNKMGKSSEIWLGWVKHKIKIDNLWMLDKVSEIDWFSYMHWEMHISRHVVSSSLKYELPQFF